MRQGVSMDTLRGKSPVGMPREDFSRMSSHTIYREHGGSHPRHACCDGPDSLP
jgi:hypothetical protein